MTAFLQNAWYLAAWSEEVSRSFLSRTILNTPIVFFRKEDGTPVALADTCPHRFAPLSLGRLDGDILQCGYHGLKYNEQGACVGNPLGKATPSAAKVRAFPLAEKDSMIWIWPGDPAQASASPVPEIPYIHDDTHYHTQVHGLKTMAANYELVMDNLMDLGHVEFLHPIFSGVLAHGKHSVHQDGNAIHSNWTTPNVTNPTFFELTFPMNGKPIDHWLEIYWHPPAVMILSAGVTPAGEPRSAGYDNVGGHILTPETEFSTHYFWHTAQSTKSNIPEDAFRSCFDDVFETEDRPMVEAVQRRLGQRDFWSMRPILLPTDAGAVRVRRTLQQLITAENEAAAGG